METIQQIQFPLTGYQIIYYVTSPPHPHPPSVLFQDITRWTRDSEVLSPNQSSYKCTSNNIDIAFCKVKTYGKKLV